MSDNEQEIIEMSEEEEEEKEYENLEEEVLALQERVRELEEENRRLQMNESLDGQAGPRQVDNKIADQVKKCITRSKIDELQKMIQENSFSVNDTLLVEWGEFFNDDMVDEDKTMSVLEYAALSGQYEACSLFLNLGADLSKDKMKEIGLAVDEAGHIHIALLLASTQITGAGSGEVQDLLQRLSRQKGIMKEFLSSLKDEENVKPFIEIMEKNVIQCIEKEIGFSDDFLNLLYFYYTTIERKPFVETNLFAVINKKCTEIINKKTVKNWYFFKQYIMTSTIWMRDGKPTSYDDFDGDEEEEEDEEDEEEEEEAENAEAADDEEQAEDGCDGCDGDEEPANVGDGDEEKVAVEKEKKDNDCLFYELLKIVNDGFEDKKKAKLQKQFKKVAEENPEHWKKLCSFDVQSTLEDQCRQNLIPGGVKPDYTHRELTKYVPSSTSFNAYQHYDVNEYLSKLLLTAHTVDKEFHQSIQNIFKINSQTNISEIKNLNGMEYQKGPVKLIARCKAKAETDYANEPFPSSACILDMNRCALIFEDISSLLAALDWMRDKINYYQSGNIVAICRDKNGFKNYDHDKPDYADIKLNVLIKGVKYNVIGEVQFMLRAMMDFKHSVHSLYSVIRREEFVGDFVKILKLRNDTNVELKRAAAIVDYNAICDLIVTHGFTPKQLLSPIDEENLKTILPSIFRNLHIKEKEKAAIRCFKLILDFVKENDSKELLQGLICDEESDDKNLALGHMGMMKLLFSEFPPLQELKESDEEELMDMCCKILSLYPEPQQFINLTTFLGIKPETIKKWATDPEMLSYPLAAKQEECVKYVLLLLPNKTARMKVLSSPISFEDDEEDGDNKEDGNDEVDGDGDGDGDEEIEATLLLYAAKFGGAMQVLLNAFDLKDRVELIDNGNLLILSMAMKTVNVAKSIIESLEGLPKEQLKYLQSSYKDTTLIEIARELNLEKFAIWVEKKIQSLQSE